MLKSLYLFLLSLLFALTSAHADVVQQKILPIGARNEKTVSVVDFSGERTLDKPRQWSIVVVPERILHISGVIANANPTNQYSKQATLTLRFQDQNGGLILSDALPYNSQLKGNFVHLAAAANPTPFFLELQIPKDAVKVDIIMSRMDSRQHVILKRLACVSTKSCKLLVKLTIAGVLFVIPLVFVCLRKHFAIVATNTSPNDFGLLVKSWRFCVVLLAIIMASVFLRNALSLSSLERYGHNSHLNLFIGYFLFLVLLTTLLYLWTYGRKRYAVFAIMIACFLLNTITIRLVHALYSQTMNFAYSDFAIPELCLVAPDVRIGHPLQYFYWCNYELLCSFLGKVLCRDIQVAQYLNAVCVTAAIYPVFKLAEKAGGFAVAIFTSLLMGCSPLLLVYTTILTNELLAASLLTFAFYFIVKTLEADELGLKLRAAISAGFFLGILHLIKSFATILITAMIIMLMLEIARYGRKLMFRGLAVLAMTIGGFIAVSECVQCACIEIAKPQIIEKSENDNVLGSLLTGLDVDSKGYYDRTKARQYRMMTREERVDELKKRLAKDFRKFPALFLEKLDRMYSEFGYAVRYIYRITTAQASVPEWLNSFMIGCHFLVLVFVTLGVVGIVVTRRFLEKSNMVGIMALLVVGAFTVALLLLEMHGRYISVIYPILFLIIPYAKVWFEKNNLLYQGVMKMAGSFKAWVAAGKSHVSNVQSRGQESEGSKR